MQSANPYLNFNGNTEEAFVFYKSVFGGEFITLVRFRDFQAEAKVGEEYEGMQVAEADLDKVAHVGLPLGGGQVLMGTDSLESMGKSLSAGNNFYIALETESADEANRLFDALSEGGTVEMALQKTEWAERYGSLVDKFSVQWMVSYTGDVQFGG